MFKHPSNRNEAIKLSQGIIPFLTPYQVDADPTEQNPLQMIECIAPFRINSATQTLNSSRIYFSSIAHLLPEPVDMPDFEDDIEVSFTAITPHAYMPKVNSLLSKKLLTSFFNYCVSDVSSFHGPSRSYVYRSEYSIEISQFKESINYKPSCFLKVTVDLASNTKQWFTHMHTRSFNYLDNVDGVIYMAEQLSGLVCMPEQFFGADCMHELLPDTASIPKQLCVVDSSRIISRVSTSISGCSFSKYSTEFEPISFRMLRKYDSSFHIRVFGLNHRNMGNNYLYASSISFLKKINVNVINIISEQYYVFDAVKYLKCLSYGYGCSVHHEAIQIQSEINMFGGVQYGFGNTAAADYGDLISCSVKWERYSCNTAKVHDDISHLGGEALRLFNRNNSSDFNVIPVITNKVNIRDLCQLVHLRKNGIFVRSDRFTYSVNWNNTNKYAVLDFDGVAAYDTRRNDLQGSFVCDFEQRPLVTNENICDGNLILLDNLWEDALPVSGNRFVSFAKKIGNVECGMWMHPNNNMNDELTNQQRNSFLNLLCAANLIIFNDKLLHN